MADLRTGTVPLIVFILAFASAAGLVLELRFLEIPQDEPGGQGQNGTGNGTGQGNPFTNTGGGNGESGSADNVAPIVTQGAGGGTVGAGSNGTPPPLVGIPMEPSPTAGGNGASGDPENVAPDRSKQGTWGGSGGAGKNEPPGGGGGPGGPGSGTNITLPDWAIWLLALLIGAILVFAGGIYIRNYLRRARASKKQVAAKAVSKKAVKAEDETLFEELSDIMDESFESIEGAEDVRTAIVLCYSRMVGALAVRGVLREKATTPREFYRKYTAKTGFSSKAMKGLTLLFEEAVYSEHPMGEEHRKRALGLLTEGLEEVKKWKEAANGEEEGEVRERKPAPTPA